MEFIATENAPKAIGPYSQAVKAGSYVYSSGQLGIDPATGKLVGPETIPQAQQVLKNLEAVLLASGCTLSSVVKTTIFLADLADFAKVNELYAEAFGAHLPARSTVQVAKLPLDARIEIECVAFCPT